VRLDQIEDIARADCAHVEQGSLDTDLPREVQPDCLAGLRGELPQAQSWDWAGFACRPLAIDRRPLAIMHHHAWRSFLVLVLDQLTLRLQPVSAGAGAHFFREFSASGTHLNGKFCSRRCVASAPWLQAVSGFFQGTNET
jgi:hypothetical protein